MGTQGSKPVPPADPPRQPRRQEPRRRPREEPARDVPPLILRPGQLVDVVTVLSKPAWLPGKVVDVWDEGFGVQVTALEPDDTGRDYRYYDLILTRTNDINCLAPFGTYTGMSEEAVEASGGFEAAVAASRASPGSRGAPAPAPAASPAPAGMSKREALRHAARMAALGVGPGTGDVGMDGDGELGISAPDAPIPAMPDPLSVPVLPPTNVLNRSKQDEGRDCDDVIEAGVEQDSFVDVLCPDHCWRVGRVVALRPGGPVGKDTEVECHVVAPTHATKGPEAVELVITAVLSDGDVAPMGRYSDTCIHAYSKQQIVDCRDDFFNRSGQPRSIWRPAEVRLVTSDHVLIHYLGWANSWDVWLNMHCDRERLAEQGSRIGDEPDEVKIARQADRDFAKAMLEQGLRVVPMAKDGSCLFRSLAHQVYGDPARHGKVRADIVAHLREHGDRYALVAAIVDPSIGSAVAAAQADKAETAAADAAETAAQAETADTAAAADADGTAAQAETADTAAADAAAPDRDGPAAPAEGETAAAVPPVSDIPTDAGAAGDAASARDDGGDDAAAASARDDGGDDAAAASARDDGDDDAAAASAAAASSSVPASAAGAAAPSTPPRPGIDAQGPDPPLVRSRSAQEQFEAYLARIAKPTSWGGDPEIMAAEELFDREIVLFSGSDFERLGHVAPMARLEGTGTALPEGREPIRLSYHGGRHYNSVELTEGPSLAARGGLGRVSTWILADFRSAEFSKGAAVHMPLSPGGAPSTGRAADETHGRSESADEPDEKGSAAAAPGVPPGPPSSFDDAGRDAWPADAAASGAGEPKA